MFQTKSDLPEPARQAVITLLQKRLSDGIELMMRAKEAHWNVKGRHFLTLHELFDKVHAEAAECVDQLAERIVQLGGIAEGKLKQMEKNSPIYEHKPTLKGEEWYLEALSDEIAVFNHSIRQGVEQAAQWQDYGTADILTQTLNTLEKTLWIIESSLVTQHVMLKAKEAA